MQAAFSPRRSGRRRAAPWTLAGLVLLFLATGSTPAAADLTAHPLPLEQSWSNTLLITTSDDWSRVRGVIGYSGDDLTTAIGADPQTVTADGATTPVDVSPNRGDPNGLIRGGVTEFDRIADPVVALQANAIADAPHLVLTVDTRMWEKLRLFYVLRDIDGSADDAVQPVAVQYRVGAAGPYANLAAGFVADATTGPGLATQVTPVDLALPADAWNQPLVQIRILTTNAAGTDEWVGVDDILVGGSSLAPGMLALEAGRYTVDEAAGEVTVQVLRTGGSKGEVAVSYATSSGSATAPSDYTATSGTLVFGDGETSRTIRIPIAEDTRNEPNETFSLALTNPTGGAGLGLASASLTIVDNDVSPPPPPQQLPFAQSWSDTNLITAPNDWSRVAGMIGHSGDDLTTAIGADPRTVTADGAATPVDVADDRGDPSGLIRGGVTEFDRIPNPTVALQANAIADAPHLLLSVDTRGLNGVEVSYLLRDLDASADNAVQAVALQYRVGDTGPYANVPAAFVADATSGPALAELTTPVTAVLPADAVGQPLVQLRFLTTNAVGTDEWVGVDDIRVIEDVNDPPALAIPDVSFPEGGEAMLNLRDYWSDTHTPAAAAVFAVYSSLFGGTVELDAASGVLRLAASDDAAGDVTISGRDRGIPPLTAIDTFHATATNVAPEIAFASPNPAALDEGGAGQVRLDYGIADPGDDAVSVSFSCGAGSLVDGSATNTRTGGTATCTFGTADDATYTVSAQATDDDAGTGAVATQTVTVRNVAPVVSSVSPQSGTVVPRGVPVSATAYYTDVGTRDVHTCTFDWGDGTTSAGIVIGVGGGGQCTAKHTYAVSGLRTVRGDVRDDDGGVGSASTTLNVL